MGFRTIAIARGRDKERLARELGANHYIDSESQDPALELQALGGARAILATVTNAQAMSRVVGGLGTDGQLLVVGASVEPIEVSPIQLIPGRRSIAGWPSGTAIDSEDTLNFSAMTGVRPKIEVYPLHRAMGPCSPAQWPFGRNMDRTGPRRRLLSVSDPIDLMLPETPLIGW